MPFVPSTHYVTRFARWSQASEFIQESEQKQETSTFVGCTRKFPVPSSNVLCTISCSSPFTLTNLQGIRIRGSRNPYSQCSWFTIVFPKGLPLFACPNHNLVVEPDTPEPFDLWMAHTIRDPKFDQASIPDEIVIPMIRQIDTLGIHTTSGLIGQILSAGGDGDKFDVHHLPSSVVARLQKKGLLEHVESIRVVRPSPFYEVHLKDADTTLQFPVLDEPAVGDVSGGDETVDTTTTKGE
jgi:hypothetical protein